MGEDEVRIGDDLLLEEARRREDILHGDVINTKASQVFAAAAFLAIQPAVILVNVPTSPHHPCLALLLIILQGAACVPMILAVYMAHLALKVADYDAPTAEDSWRDNVYSTLEPVGGEASEDCKRAHLTWALLISTRERCEAVQRVNSERLKSLNPARHFLLFTMILNAVSLAFIVAIRLF